MQGMLILSISRMGGQLGNWSKKVWCTQVDGNHLHITAVTEARNGESTHDVLVELGDAPSHHVTEIPSDIAELAKHQLDHFKKS